MVGEGLAQAMNERHLPDHGCGHLSPAALARAVFLQRDLLVEGLAAFHEDPAPAAHQLLLGRLVDRRALAVAYLTAPVQVDHASLKALVCLVCVGSLGEYLLARDDGGGRVSVLHYVNVLGEWVEVLLLAKRHDQRQLAISDGGADIGLHVFGAELHKRAVLVLILY